MGSRGGGMGESDLLTLETDPVSALWPLPLLGEAALLAQAAERIGTGDGLASAETTARAAETTARAAEAYKELVLSLLPDPSDRAFVRTQMQKAARAAKEHQQNQKQQQRSREGEDSGPEVLRAVGNHLGLCVKLVHTRTAQTSQTAQTVQSAQTAQTPQTAQSAVTAAANVSQSPSGDREGQDKRGGDDPSSNLDDTTFETPLLIDESFAAAWRPDVDIKLHYCASEFALLLFAAVPPEKASLALQLKTCFKRLSAYQDKALSALHKQRAQRGRPKPKTTSQAGPQSIDRRNETSSHSRSRSLSRRAPSQPRATNEETIVAAAGDSDGGSPEAAEERNRRRPPELKNAGLPIGRNLDFLTALTWALREHLVDSSAETAATLPDDVLERMRSLYTRDALETLRHVGQDLGLSPEKSEWVQSLTLAYHQIRFSTDFDIRPSMEDRSSSFAGRPSTSFFPGANASRNPASPTNAASSSARWGARCDFIFSKFSQDELQKIFNYVSEAAAFYPMAPEYTIPASHPIPQASTDPRRRALDPAPPLCRPSTLRPPHSTTAGDAHTMSHGSVVSYGASTGGCLPLGPAFGPPLAAALTASPAAGLAAAAAGSGGPRRADDRSLAHVAVGGHDFRLTQRERDNAFPQLRPQSQLQTQSQAQTGSQRGFTGAALGPALGPALGQGRSSVGTGGGGGRLWAVNANAANATVSAQPSQRQSSAGPPIQFLPHIAQARNQAFPALQASLPTGPGRPSAPNAEVSTLPRPQPHSSRSVSSTSAAGTASQPPIGPGANSSVPPSVEAPPLRAPQFPRRTAGPANAPNLLARAQARQTGSQPTYAQARETDTDERRKTSQAQSDDDFCEIIEPNFGPPIPTRRAPRQRTNRWAAKAHIEAEREAPVSAGSTDTSSNPFPALQRTNG